MVLLRLSTLHHSLPRAPQSLLIVALLTIANQQSRHSHIMKSFKSFSRSMFATASPERRPVVETAQASAADPTSNPSSADNMSYVHFLLYLLLTDDTHSDRQFPLPIPHGEVNATSAPMTRSTPESGSITIPIRLYVIFPSSTTMSRSEATSGRHIPESAAPRWASV